MLRTEITLRQVRGSLRIIQSNSCCSTHCCHLEKYKYPERKIHLCTTKEIPQFSGPCGSYCFVVLPSNILSICIYGQWKRCYQKAARAQVFTPCSASVLEKENASSFCLTLQFSHVRIDPALTVLKKWQIFGYYCFLAIISFHLWFKCKGLRKRITVFFLYRFPLALLQSIEHHTHSSEGIKYITRDQLYQTFNKWTGIHPPVYINIVYIMKWKVKTWALSLLFFFYLQYTKLYNIFIGYFQNGLNIYILHSLALEKLHINYSGKFLNSV